MEWIAGTAFASMMDSSEGPVFGKGGTKEEEKTKKKKEEENKKLALLCGG